MKRPILFISALIFMLFTGCASGKIHQRSYLRAAAVSGERGGELVLAFFDDDTAVEASGEDTDAAQRAAELKNGKPVFTGYTELIIIDGTDCRERLVHMLTDWKVSPSCMVIYCGNGGTLLKEWDTEKLIGAAKQAVEQGIAPECDVITVLGKLCIGHTAEIAELYADGTAGSHIIY
ncbi:MULTISPECIES: hypothetical protein [Ruminococcus]|uniref:Uncharacterized protein n=1 Tax=Ruminococcus flavefaciens TaxID=1265 RepID=A0A1M7M032_RUMFL|nr:MULTISPECIES: hypothetical protein [Ruminococcus]MCR4795612.1 hypothetical protein [Ruminococcus sp.]SHM83871.1 hypothetical protein SAMN04487860_11745 [Ruminococcus flavefaciens]